MKLSIFTTLFAALACLGVVDASFTIFDIVMNPAQNVVSCASTTIGNGVFTLSGSSLCARVSFGALTSTTTATVSSVGLYAGAIGSAGSLVSALTPVSGTHKVIQCVTLSSANLALLKAGGLYVAVKSSACTSGETRGQILTTAV